jgi:hypothetical protein
MHRTGSNRDGSPKYRCAIKNRRSAARWRKQHAEEWRAYHREWRAQNRDRVNEYERRRHRRLVRDNKALARLIKTQRGCEQRGCTERRPHLLEFHHVEHRNGNGKPIASMYSVSPSRFLLELSRCRVLCERHTSTSTIGARARHDAPR